MRQRRPEWSQMQRQEKQRQPEDLTRLVTIHVVVLEEPEAAGRSLYLDNLGQEQNCCDWRRPENDSRVQGLRSHEHRVKENDA